jgi:hypothetical protein
MNRKNLTAAVLAGLAGAAGLAGTAQAVNLNPDGLGQVLIYPYYTANDGNNTLLSVVNTTDNAKAVKVRFLEGFNSREVLDFNLYLSHHDVWTAAITKADALVQPTAAAYETDTFLIINDDSCTVPYLYEDRAVEMPDGSMAGVQPFLNLAFTGNFTDGGPTSDARVQEGHFEMIEMGTIEPGSDTEKDITHALNKEGEWKPGDCDQLVDNWTNFATGTDGIWYNESLQNDGSTNSPTFKPEDCLDDDDDPVENQKGCGQATTDTLRNSGGLFGGAAIVNPAAGAMYSYDAKAIQGFDSTGDGIHYIPGTIRPSLNSGNESVAWVFFGVPQNTAVDLQYSFGVDAVSAVFMHEYTMNEYTTADIPAEAATEWVVTFPTKNFYVDPLRMAAEGDVNWQPAQGLNSKGLPFGEPLASCNLWEPGEKYPTYLEDSEISINKKCGDNADLGDVCVYSPFGETELPGWGACEYVAVPFNVDPDEARAPFTELYGEDDCELVSLVTYDRDERTFKDTPGGRPPTVSPAPPIVPGEDVIFELCNEVNVLRFGERSIFGTLEDVDGESLLVTVNDEFTDGWGWINYYLDDDHIDSQDLAGLPVTGFAAYQFENDFVEGDDGTVKAFYGGTFWHKGNVRQDEVSIND